MKTRGEGFTSFPSFFYRNPCPLFLPEHFPRYLFRPTRCLFFQHGSDAFQGYGDSIQILQSSPHCPANNISLIIKGNDPSPFLQIPSLFVRVNPFEPTRPLTFFTTFHFNLFPVPARYAACIGKHAIRPGRLHPPMLQFPYGQWKIVVPPTDYAFCSNLFHTLSFMIRVCYNGANFQATVKFDHCRSYPFAVYRFSLTK